MLNFTIVPDFARSFVIFDVETLFLPNTKWPITKAERGFSRRFAINRLL